MHTLRLICGSISFTLASAKFQSIYAFGDSLTDVGNVYKLTNGVKPRAQVYYEGRFSNGPTWIEYLTKQLKSKNLISFAHGGATSDNDLVNSFVPSFKQQVNDFFDAHVKTNHFDPESSLVSVWFSGNDYFFDPTIVPQLVVPRLAYGLEKLLQIYDVKYLLVSALVPLESVPGSKDYFGEQFRYVESRVKFHNKMLEQVLDDLQKRYPSSKITFNRADDRWTELIKSNPVYNIEGEWDSLHSCINTTTTMLDLACQHPQHHFYYDEFHPTTFVHQELADKAYSTIASQYL